MRHRFGDYELDEDAGELRHRGAAVEIQPKPLALLALLVRERARVVPARELIDSLWPDTRVSPASLTRAISHARRAIGDTNRGALIRSVSRRGYRFCADVVELDLAAAPPPAASGAGRVFVGREDPLARLERAFADAVERRGTVALITGPAGIGKTRLLEHFASHAEARGARVLLARSHSDDGVPPFWLWVQVLRQLHESDSNELARLVPELGGTPGAQRFLLFDAVARALASAARARPLVIALEDLQWADAGSLRLLEHLAFEAAGEALLVVATVREGFRERGHPLDRTLAALRQQERTVELALAGFSRREVALWLDRVLGRPAPSDLISDLFARTEGVPLFLREAIRLLGERGALDAPERLPRVGVALPGRALDLIRRALDSLSQRAGTLVASASVLGREFTLAAAAEVAQLERDESLDLCDEATRAGVLEASPDAAASWRFTHALFREGAYSGLAAGERVRLHLRAARRLEREHAGDLEPVIAELAHHHHRALAVGEPVRALEFSRAAAARAARLGAWEQAVRHYEDAVAALPHVRPLAPEDRIGVLLELGETCRLSGDRARRREVLGQAIELARAHGRPVDQARAAIALTDLQDWSARDEEARDAVGEALAAIGFEPRPVRARLLTRLAYHEIRAAHDAAQRMARQAVALAREDGEPESLQDALYVLHFSLGGPDHTDERAQLGEEIVRAALDSRSSDRALIALIDLASDRVMLGDAAGARALRARAAQVAGERPAPMMRWHEGVYDTGIAVLEGRFGDAAALAQDTLGFGRRVEHPYAAGVFAGQRAMLARERGDAAEVLAAFEPGVGARVGPFHWIRALVARARLALGRVDDARSLFDELAAEDFADVPRNLRWTGTFVELAHLCAELDDAARAKSLRAWLAPVEHQHGAFPVAVFYGGPVRFALARLAETLGERDDALGLYAESLEDSRALGARPTEARIGARFGRALEPREPKRARALLAEAERTAQELGLAGLGYSNESARR